MPRQRTSVEKLAQDKPAKKPAQQSTRAKKKAVRGKSKQRPTVAQSLARQRRIVVAREVEQMTWGAIAEELKMDERDVRRAYETHITEVAPLLAEESPPMVALEYMRALEAVRQQLVKAAGDAGDHVSARVGALREAVATLSKEIELRQHLGLFPKDLGNLQTIVRLEYMAVQCARLLRRYNAPPQAIEELKLLLAGKELPDQHPVIEADVAASR